MKRLKRIWEYYDSEIRNLASLYVVIALLVVFMAWGHAAKGFVEFLVVLAAIATPFIAIPTIMGTMVLTSDILEELLKREDE